jgi:GGDEF domain-containing protein
LSASIGFIDVTPGGYKHQAQVMDAVRRGLSDAKKKGGNQLVKSA